MTIKQALANLETATRGTRLVLELLPQASAVLDILALGANRNDVVWDDGESQTSLGIFSSKDLEELARGYRMRASGCNTYAVKSVRGKLKVNAVSKEDAVQQYAFFHGYRTLGSPDFSGRDAWEDHQDGQNGIRYTVSQVDFDPFATGELFDQERLVVHGN